MLSIKHVSIILKTKQELIKLVNDKRIYLGNIDTSAITDMSNLFSIIKDSRFIENNREEFWHGNYYILIIVLINLL